MAFKFISDTVIFLLTYVKHLIIINYQLLNYGVNKAAFRLEVLISQTFLNI